MQERQTKLGGLEVSYKVIGAGKTPVVLLHGWGVSSDRYVVTAQTILDRDGGFVFYVPDLPGFGRSAEPPTDWTLDDYAEFAREFVRTIARRDSGFESAKAILEKSVQPEGAGFKVEEKKIVLLAHSFGGRIALKYAAKYPEDIETLVLTGAAGIKHPLSGKQRVVRILAQAGGFFFRLPLLGQFKEKARRMLYAFSPEKDYGKASKRMQAVMRNALAEDLTPLLERIKVRTILIWGRLDHSTPLRDAEIMRERISGADFFVIEDANHSAVYNQAEGFARIFTENISRIAPDKKLNPTK